MTRLRDRADQIIQAIVPQSGPGAGRVLNRGDVARAAQQAEGDGYRQGFQDATSLEWVADLLGVRIDYAPLAITSEFGNPVAQPSSEQIAAELDKRAALASFGEWMGASQLFGSVSRAINKVVARGDLAPPEQMWREVSEAVEDPLPEMVRPEEVASCAEWFIMARACLQQAQKEEI